MAEAFVEHRCEGTVIARSAGSHPKPRHPNAVLVMRERGIDIAGRPTKSLSRFARSRFDRIVTLCDKVREVCPEFPGAPETAHWSIGDPAAGGGDDATTKPEFERVAVELERRIALLLTDLSWGATDERNQHD
jgi:protein-tyrosine-phosphatase